MSPRAQQHTLRVVLAVLSAAVGAATTALATGEAGAALPAPGPVRVQVDHNTAQLARIDERISAIASDVAELRADMRELRGTRLASGREP